MARWLVVTSAFDGVCLSMSNRSHLRSLASCLPLLVAAAEAMWRQAARKSKCYRLKCLGSVVIWPRIDWMSQGTPLMGSAPAAPTVSASDASVKVQWEAGSTSHNIYRATNVDGPWMAVALMRDGTSITDAPVQKGIGCYYAVSANAVTSESPLSPAVVSMSSR